MADSSSLFGRAQGVAHALLGASYIYAALAAVAGFLAFLVGYANRKSGEFSSTVNSLIGDNLYNFILVFRYEIAILSLIIIFGMVVTKFLFEKRKLRKISHWCDDFMVQYARLRDLISDLLMLPAGDHEITADKYVLMLREVEDFLENSAGTLQKIFMLYTGRRCHVAIKTYNNKNKTVLTVARDKMSLIDRHSIDEYKPSMNYKENTAFESILDSDDRSVYFSNHLILQSIIGRYKNSHDGWRGFYNATVVVPITCKRHPGSITRDTVWGFLSIDNRGGGFDRKVCSNLLLSFSRIYYGLFQVVARVHCREEVAPAMLPDGGLRRWAQ